MAAIFAVRIADRRTGWSMTVTVPDLRPKAPRLLELGMTQLPLGLGLWWEKAGSAGVGANADPVPFVSSFDLLWWDFADSGEV
jgi:hypothetical protein